MLMISERILKLSITRAGEVKNQMPPGSYVSTLLGLILRLGAINEIQELE